MRPEGWNETYTKYPLLNDPVYKQVYEAGADAMLGGLIRDSKKPKYRDGKKGINVFIPEEE